ncbi:hypothetical protein ACFQPB_07225 [Hydrogenophaga atypica]|uniref:Uncharacterized protein n=1 Tax=Hydrogenophaga atypica TaxID=249409 RepID=A0ABW2QJ62_9BURK
MSGNNLMTTPTSDIEKALEDALDALAGVTTRDVSTTTPEVSIDVIMKMAAVVVALEELEYQQLVAGHESGGSRVLH